ncbi:ribonuclease R [Ferrimonas lipolytica]|uniref:Ribonuclease R n=1 Tax=Ferrimonas lipolytica TaxID=2724191 RepID=A0A6H1UHS7_9GAMM|nr:ribonuclease R [Ferrimonas lipolytica]QIZ78657.1 ribonuclease R [Ferrimonas lipolytica]
MSHDPNFNREAEKYANPIASREFILAFMQQQNAPVAREELAAHFDLEGDQFIALSRRLRAMERDGQIVYTRKGRYGLPERMNLITGTVLGHRDGFGFFRPEDGSDDLYLPEKAMFSVLHGDKVMAQIDEGDRRGRKSARIVRVVEPRNPMIVGRYFLDEGIGYVVPDDSRLSQDILIPEEGRNGAREGQVVVAELVKRPAHHTHGIGRVDEVLGNEMQPGMEIEMALRSHDLPHVFSEALLAETAKIADEVTEEDKQGRRDLRNLPLVTIDGEDARDFDDAVYAEAKKSGGWRLYVAIADVSHYVRPGMELDKEGLARGNSVYFPAQVIPMLPEKLSNGLCSLNPHVDRLCMVAEMTVSAAGKLSGYKFYPAVMHSHARLTYTKVAKMLDGDGDLCAEYAEVLPHLHELHQLYQTLDSARQQRGALVLESEETQFIFNEERRIEKIVPRSRNVAHKMIEECMILANVAAGKFVKKHHGDVLYRIHEGPSEQKLLTLRDFLKQQGLELKGGTEPSPLDVQELLLNTRERGDAELIQTMVLRSMKQAVYSADNIGHFGLALDSYAHFTSPIRRYPDLVLHRVIRYLSAKEQNPELPLQQLLTDGGFGYAEGPLAELGEHTSMTERRADDASRDVSDWLKCEFMLDHVGDDFEAVVSGVTSFGLFVRLKSYHIDGLVHISSLANDYYNFDPLRQALVGESSGKRYRLGDEVQVKVMAVKLDDRQIDLALFDADAPKPKAKRRSGGSKRTSSSKAKSGAAAKGNLRSGKDAPKDEKKPSRNKKSGRSGGDKARGGSKNKRTKSE